MSHRKKPQKNSVKLPKRNKYIHPNSIAKSMECCDSSSESDIEPIFDSNRNHSNYNNRNIQSIFDDIDDLVTGEPEQKEPEVPDRINHPLFILSLEGKSIGERRRKSHLNCSTSKADIQAHLLYILRGEKVEEPLENFTFNWAESIKDDASTIYDYDLSNVNWELCKCFVLRQVKSTPTPQPQSGQYSSFTKQANKQRMENKYQEIRRAELTLRKNLGIAMYNKLKSNKPAFIEARYGVASGTVPWEQVEASIYKRVFGGDTTTTDSTSSNNGNTSDNKPVINSSSHPQSLQASLKTIESTLVSVKDCLCELVKAQKNSSIPYQSVHRASTSVESTRYNPTRNSIDNDSMPRIVASLPHTIALDLPSLNDKEEID